MQWVRQTGQNITKNREKLDGTESEKAGCQGDPRLAARGRDGIAPPLLCVRETNGSH